MSFPSTNLITSILYYMCQSHHYHTNKTLPSDCFKTRVAIKPVDQTNEAYKSNIG